MLEHAHHVLGTCGETHPSIISMILGGLGLTGIWLIIKYKFYQFKSFFKNEKSEN